MAKRSEHTHIARSREKIRSGLVLDKLIRYYNADPKDEDETKRPGAIMTPSQVQLGLSLLKKTIPDLSAQSVVVHDARDKHPRDMTLEELYDECVNSIQSNSNSPTQH